MYHYDSMTMTAYRRKLKKSVLVGRQAIVMATRAETKGSDLELQALSRENKRSGERP